MLLAFQTAFGPVSGFLCPLINQHFHGKTSGFRPAKISRKILFPAWVPLKENVLPEALLCRPAEIFKKRF